MIGWLVGWLVDWFVGLLIDWSVGRSDGLIGGLIRYSGPLTEG